MVYIYIRVCCHLHTVQRKQRALAHLHVERRRWRERERKRDFIDMELCKVNVVDTTDFPLTYTTIHTTHSHHFCWNEQVSEWASERATIDFSIVWNIYTFQQDKWFLAVHFQYVLNGWGGGETSRVLFPFFSGVFPCVCMIMVRFGSHIA